MTVYNTSNSRYKMKKIYNINVHENIKQNCVNGFDFLQYY